MAPFSFIASAIFSLAGAFTLRTNAERLSNDKLVLGPDHDGYCHLGSNAGEIVPCPLQKPISPGIIIGMMVAVFCALVLVVAAFVWRHRVRVRTGSPPLLSFPICSVNSAKTSPLANKASIATATVVDLESAEGLQGEKGNSKVYLLWSERPRLIN